MVGVPRSKGCLACLKRRVKCDETHPECQCCRRRRLTCPGYIRDRKLSNQFSTSLHQLEHPNTKSARALSSISIGHVLSHGQKYAVISRKSMPIDGAIAPSLVTRSVDQQYTKQFDEFMKAVFPHSYRTGTGDIWVDFAHRRPKHEKILSLSLHSLGSLHLGRVNKNEGEILRSREVYGHGLRHLSQAIKTPAMSSTDVTVAAAILLGVYELLNPTGEELSLLHSRGISQLFLLRGPKAHATGFGRTFLLTFRGLMVFEAFAAGKACFLGNEEWRAIVPIALSYLKHCGRAAGIIELIEFAFNEIAQCPGFLVMTKSLISSTCTTNAERENLIVVINASKDTLKNLKRKMLIGLKTCQDETEIDRQRFFGATPKSTAYAWTQYAIEGVHSAIALLQQLLTVLLSDQSRRTVATAGLMLDPTKTEWEMTKDPTVIAQMSREHTRTHFAAGPQLPTSLKLWPDRLILTLGMPGKG